MSPTLYLLTILALPVTAVVVFAMKYASSYAAARARAAEEAGLRAALARTTDLLAGLDAAVKALAEEQARQARLLADVDAMLREVG